MLFLEDNFFDITSEEGVDITVDKKGIPEPGNGRGSGGCTSHQKCGGQLLKGGRTYAERITGSVGDTLHCHRYGQDGGKCDRMQAEADAAGCRLRPHIKTHKMPLFARMQLAHGAAGITCAKVSEAEVMADGERRIFLSPIPWLAASG